MIMKTINDFFRGAKVLFAVGVVIAFVVLFFGITAKGYRHFVYYGDLLPLLGGLFRLSLATIPVFVCTGVGWYLR